MGKTGTGYTGSTGVHREVACFVMSQLDQQEKD